MRIPTVHFAADRLGSLLLAPIVLVLLGCPEPPTAPEVEEVPPPRSPVTISMTFKVDDSANRTHTMSDQLTWKGSFSHDESTNVLRFDNAWSGPFPLLYDDGPTSGGGHEEEGATAGDHVWGVQVLVEASVTEDIDFEYGAVRGSGADEEWIWTGPNGNVTVSAGETDAVEAPGLTLQEFGTTDMRVALDTRVLSPGVVFEPGTDPVVIRGRAWGGPGIVLIDGGTLGDAVGGDEIFTFELGQHVGPGTSRPHNGLLNVGDRPDFVFELGGTEYKVGDSASTDGIRTEIRPDGASGWGSVPIETDSAGGTFITIGEPSAQPLDHVAINFVVDDNVNQSYSASDALCWKGSFDYDPVTNVLSKDATWHALWPRLFDDGPWDAGGHEPTGAVAGDHNWGVTVFAESSPTETLTFAYGLVGFAQVGADGTTCGVEGEHDAGERWLWPDVTDGTFEVVAGATSDVDVPTLVLPAHGTIDIQLELDTNALDPAFTPNTDWTTISVRSRNWGWLTSHEATDDGSRGDFASDDGVYTYVLGQDATYDDGLLNDDEVFEWVFEIQGVEYKVDEMPLGSGVRAQVSRNGGMTWEPVTVGSCASGGAVNTCISVPSG